MTPTHANKGAKLYRYYVSAPLIAKEENSDSGSQITGRRSAAMRVPAGDLEALTLDRLRTFLASQRELADTLDGAGLDASALDAALRAAAALAQNWPTIPREKAIALVRALVDRVVVEKDHISLQLRETGLGAELWVTPPSDHRSHRRRELIVLTFDMALRRAGREKRLVVGDGRKPCINPGLIALLDKAFVIRDALFSGSDRRIEAMTERLGAAKAYVASLIRLSYLSPAIVGEILAGTPPIALTPTGLL